MSKLTAFFAKLRIGRGVPDADSLYPQIARNEIYYDLATMSQWVDQGGAPQQIGRGMVPTVDFLRKRPGTQDGELIDLQTYATAGDGGAGTFRWDAASTADDDGGVTIAPTGVSTGRWVREYDGPVRLEWWDFTLDSSAAASANSALLEQIIGAGHTHIEGHMEGDLHINATLEITNTVRYFWTPQQLRFRYNGSGTAVKLTALKYSDVQISAIRNVREWFDGDAADNIGTDTTSVGVHIVNCDDCNIRIPTAWWFHTNVIVQGDAQGCAYNNFYCGSIRDGYTCLRIEAINSGWSNENRYWGGFFNISPTYGGAVGSRVISMGSTVNNNTFFGATIESTGQEEAAIYCEGNYNMWINPRLESVPAGHVKLYGDANIVMGGYHNWGPDGDIFDITGDSTVIGARGASFIGDDGTFGGAAIKAKGLGSQSTRVLEIIDFNDDLMAWLDAGGTLKTFGGAGYDAGGTRIYPTAQWNGPNHSIDFGDTGGTVEPVPAFRAFAQAFFELRHRMWINPANGGDLLINTAALPTGSYPSADKGVLFYTNNSSATTVLDFTGEQSTKFILIYGADGGNTTFKHDNSGAGLGPIRTKSGGDVTLADNETIQFLVTNDGLWLEV